MKTLLFYSLILVLNLTSSYAQLPSSDKQVVKVGGEDYRISTSGKSKIISNVKSDQYSNRKLPYNLDDLDMSGINAARTSTDIIKEIKRTLSMSRMDKMSKNNDIMTITVVFNSSGKINHVDYFVYGTSTISVQDIAIIDEAIKKNVKVSMTKPELYKKLPYVVFIPHHIRFAKLYP